MTLETTSNTTAPEIISIENESPRTVPKRVLANAEVNVGRSDRFASLVFGLFAAGTLGAFLSSRRPTKAAWTAALASGATGYAFLRRAITGRSRLYDLVGLATDELPSTLLSSAVPVRKVQRTITIRASIPEIELFLADPPKLHGFEIGRDLAIDFVLRPGPPAAGTEVQARLLTIPAQLQGDRADRVLREILRSAKQLIETGEIATSEVHV